MTQTDFKKIGDIIAKNVSQQIKPAVDDQATLLRSIKTDLKGVGGRLGIVEDHVDILKQEVRETKERSEEIFKDIKQIKDEIGEIHETVDALFADMVDTQKQIGGIYDEMKVVGDKWNNHGQRISRLNNNLTFMKLVQKFFSKKPLVVFLFSFFLALGIFLANGQKVRANFNYSV